MTSAVNNSRYFMNGRGGGKGRKREQGRAGQMKKGEKDGEEELKTEFNTTLIAGTTQVVGVQSLLVCDFFIFF